MRKARFTEEQMVRILREADKTPVADVAKKHGISEQTIKGRGQSTFLLGTTTSSAGPRRSMNEYWTGSEYVSASRASNTPAGRKAAEGDERGRRTEFKYDALGRLKEVHLAAGTTSAGRPSRSTIRPGR